MAGEPALLVLLGATGLGAGAFLRHQVARVPAGATPGRPPGLPLVAVGNAALWVAAGVRFGPHLVILPFLVLFSALLVLSLIDFEHSVLPNRITYPAVLFTVVAIPVVSIVVGRPHTILGAAAGGIGYFLLLFIPAVVYPKGMGFGDVKLAGLMGLYLGWIHPLLALPALVIASVIGLVAGVVLLLKRGASRPYPFGPWLALGCVLTILFSGPLLSRYGY